MKHQSLPVYAEQQANRIARMPAFYKRWEGGIGHAGARARTWNRIEKDLFTMGFDRMARVQIKTDIVDLAKLIWNSEASE